MEICSIEKCGKKVNTSGYCRMHYGRWLTHKDPNLSLMEYKKITGIYYKIPPKFEMLLEKFFNNKSIENECWNWIGSKSRGYGQVQYKGRRRIVHRESYKYFVGKIPEGMLCCHKCDNPSCFNPSHLFIGSSFDNTHDMINKGRKYLAKGEKSHYAKLTEADVIEIKKFIKNGFKDDEIAAVFKVIRQTINMIRNNKNWKHVEDI